MSNNNSFCSKILLFGEYSIIKNSMALAIPYPLFEGALRFPNNNSRSIDPELKAFSLYLKKLKQQSKLDFNLSVDAFAFDVSEGLMFDSTIPQGHGGGSSGALCAAVFDRYGMSREEGRYLDVHRLKQIFAALESHFHGSSSGMDPLVSYLNSGLLLKNKQELGPIQIPNFKAGKGGIFLLNTDRPRRTGPLVDLFLEKCRRSDFEQLCEQRFIPHTNACIQAFLNQDLSQLFEHFFALSRFQFEHLRPMIPTLYEDYWQQGLEHQHYCLKLCGAGGGGWLLGITEDFDRMGQALQGQQIRPVLRF